MLRVENLSCGYNGTDVVNSVTFTAVENEKLFIIGPNGCGKTTLLRAIAGLLPYSGTVYIDESDTGTLSKKELSRKVALMSQFSEIYFSYSVYETVMQGRYAHLKESLFKTETQTDREVVASCLEITGLLELKDKNIQELSGGQLQRVFLARVLAQEPQIILLDEPTNHLDLRYQLEFMSYLEEWVKLPGRIVVGVIHDLNLALSFADRLMILQDGEVFAQGNCGEIDLELIDQTFNTNVKDYMVQSLKKWER